MKINGSCDGSSVAGCVRYGAHRAIKKELESAAAIAIRVFRVNAGERWSNFDPLDVGAQAAQLFVNQLVAAIDVIDTIDLRHSLGFETG